MVRGKWMKGHRREWGGRMTVVFLGRPGRGPDLEARLIDECWLAYGKLGEGGRVRNISTGKGGLSGEDYIFVYIVDHR